MKTLVKYLAVTITILQLCGCASIMGPGKLELSPYRRNIIVRADASVLIEDQVIDFRIFHKELIQRAFTDKERIILHVHEDVSDKVFTAIYDKLLELGFKNVQPALYKD